MTKVIPIGIKRLKGHDRLKPRKGAKCPDWLCDRGRREWNRLAPELEEQGLLTILDQTAFEIHCDLVATCEGLEKALEEAAPGGLEATRMSLQAAKRELRAYARLFGLAADEREAS